MEGSRSTRSCNRARTTERGFALAMALIIAVLYFGLIELMLYDASRELAEARRFRARIVALTLAENGAERAAWMIVPKDTPPLPAIADEDWQGSITGSRTKNAETGEFTIKASGKTTGVVEVIGKVDGMDVDIYYTRHSQ